MNMREGILHVALAVRDLDRTTAFYGAVLGTEATHRDDGILHLDLPGHSGALIFEKKPGRAASPGGALNFAMRIKPAIEFDAAIKAVPQHGGTIAETGTSPQWGDPYLVAKDPDGYEMAMWYGGGYVLISFRIE